MRWGVFVRTLLAWYCALAVGGFARAGAFLLGEGDFQLISASRFTGSVHAFGNAGKLNPVGYYSKFELSPYIEYGATEYLTLIAQPTLTRAIAEGPPAGSFYGLGSIEAGARFRLGEWEQTVFSAQAVAHIAIARDALNPALVGNTGNEFDLRLLAGRSFKIGDFDAFADAQAGYRFRSAGSPNEIRADFTIGVRPFRRLQLLAQSFNTIAPASGAPGFPAFRQHKIQLTALFDISKRYTIYSGLFTTIAGRSARQEYGMVSGFAYRF